MNRELVKKGFWTLLFRAFGALLAFIMVIVFARLLGAEQFGLYSLSLTLITILSVFVRVGLDNVVLRHVSAHLDDQKELLDAYVSSSIKLVTIVGGVGALLVWGLAPSISNYVFQKPHLQESLQLFSLVLLPLSLVAIISEIMKAYGKAAYSAFMQVVFPASITLIVVYVYWVLDLISLSNIIFSFLLGILSVVIVYLWGLRDHLRYASMSSYKVSYRSLLRQGWPMLLVSSGALIMAWSDVIVLGIFAPASEVGIYSAASRIVLVSSLVLIAVNAVTAPRFARFYKEGEIEKIAGLAQVSTAILFVIVLLPSVMFLLFSDFVMAFLGEAFVAGATVLAILAIGQFINVSCGSVVYLLTMTGKEVVLRNIMLASALLNVVLSLALVQIYGMEGVAIATAISLALWNLWAMYEVRKHLGFWTLSFSVLLKVKAMKEDIISNKN